MRGGAAPGALPPVTGWVAARGDLGLGAAVLFAILFLWQLPHSLAIARLYADDYARAGGRGARRLWRARLGPRGAVRDPVPLATAALARDRASLRRRLCPCGCPRAPSRRPARDDVGATDRVVDRGARRRQPAAGGDRARRRGGFGDVGRAWRGT